MHLDVTRIDRGRLREVFRIRPDDPLLDGYEPEVREPFRLDVELANPSHGTYVMTARLSGTAFEPCRRCLSPVAVEIEDRFRMVYQEDAREGETDSGDDDLVRLSPGATRIDISREIRDRLFLETERYPLCREECRGVCPECGENWNEGNCECETTAAADVRWSALREVRARALDPEL
jgi:uncharacterized protein